MTVAKNDITGDQLQTKTASDAYRDGWDRIFGQRLREAALDKMVEDAQKLGLYDDVEPKNDNS